LRLSACIYLAAILAKMYTSKKLAQRGLTLIYRSHLTLISVDRKLLHGRHDDMMDQDE